MKLEKYDVKSNKSKTTFKFVSEGPNGNILKRIEYSKKEFLNFKNVYNLAFGDLDPSTGEIDDLIITNNQDREKVLATVANTIIIFTKRYPKAYIYIEGSNTARTRLYQMAISKYFLELSESFDIQGIRNFELLSFEMKVNYSAFLIRRKLS
jgi:hypothetical protein